MVFYLHDEVRNIDKKRNPHLNKNTKHCGKFIQKLLSISLCTLTVLCLNILPGCKCTASANKFNFSTWNKQCPSTLVVINKDNPIPDNYKTSLASYQGKSINTVLLKDLDDMVLAAARDGVKIFIWSGYRTIEQQTKLFNAQVSKCKQQGYSGKEAYRRAAMVVARPKTSEHNTGLAIDFNCVSDDFYKTKEFDWLIKNAHKYGFILRYEKNKINQTGVIYEPWHFRYVGKEYSTKIVESGLCLEEYISQRLM